MPDFCSSDTQAPQIVNCGTAQELFFPKALRRVLPCGALGQLAQSSLHRVTSMEISGALGQLAQSSLHRVTSMEIPAWRYQHGDTRAELLAQSSLHRVTSISMETLAQSHQHGDVSMEILAQSHQHGDTCTESPAWSHQHRCVEPSA